MAERLLLAQPVSVTNHVKERHVADPASRNALQPKSRLLAKQMSHIIQISGTDHHYIGAGKFEHITPTLRDVLHWLPVTYLLTI